MFQSTQYGQPDKSEIAWEDDWNSSESSFNEPSLDRDQLDSSPPPPPLKQSQTKTFPPDHQSPRGKPPQDNTQQSKRQQKKQQQQQQVLSKGPFSSLPEFPAQRLKKDKLRINKDGVPEFVFPGEKSLLKKARQHSGAAFPKDFLKKVDSVTRDEIMDYLERQPRFPEEKEYAKSRRLTKSWTSFGGAILGQVIGGRLVRGKFQVVGQLGGFVAGIALGSMIAAIPIRPESNLNLPVVQHKQRWLSQYFPQSPLYQRMEAAQQQPGAFFFSRSTLETSSEQWDSETVFDDIGQVEELVEFRDDQFDDDKW